MRSAAGAAQKWPIRSAFPSRLSNDGDFKVVISRRERVIGIATGAILGIFLLDRAVIEPFVAQRTELKGQIAEQETKLRNAKQLLNSSRQMNRKWAELSSGKLTRVQG